MVYGHVLYDQLQQGYISSAFLAKWIGTSQKTAWKVGHAVRALMTAQADAMPGLAGIVELDEKHLGGKPRY